MSIARPILVTECYDPGNGTVKNGRPRHFATLASAMKAAETQRAEYGSDLHVFPGAGRYLFLSPQKNLTEICWR